MFGYYLVVVHYAKEEVGLILKSLLPPKYDDILFSFAIALILQFLIFNLGKAFCTYILPLTVKVDVLLEELLSFLAQEYTVRDSKNVITIM